MKMDGKKHLTILITPELKEEFQILCIRNKTKMSFEMIKFIEKYVRDKGQD